MALDHIDTLEFYQLTLEFAGAHVFAEPDANAVLERARHLVPHAVVTDLSLRGNDGFWLAERLHAIAPSLPVIAITGRGYLIQGAPFASVLIKPIDGETLCAEVVRHIWRGDER